MTTTIGHRQRILDLPEAGKPEGTCPECGPHGNRGWVDLSVWRRHVVPCLTCSARANNAALTIATRLALDIADEIDAEGCHACFVDRTMEIDPPEHAPDHPWQRRVTVTMPYRHARKADAPADLQAQIVAMQAQIAAKATAIAATRSAIAAAKQAQASKIASILGVP